MMRPEGLRETGVPETVMSGALGSKVVLAIIMPPFAARWIWWPVTGGRVKA